MYAPQAHMAFVARCSSRLNVFSPCHIKVFHFMVNDLGGGSLNSVLALEISRISLSTTAKQLRNKLQDVWTTSFRTRVDTG